MSEQMPYHQKLALIKAGKLPKETGPKPKKHLPKFSAKKLAEREAEKKARGGDDTALVKWFKSQMKVMPTRCEETGLPLETKVYKYAINSICHILPKQSCKSVALHPLNRVFLDQDFHKKFDAMSWEEREQLKCWPEIRDRLVMVYPDLAPDERRHFPDSVLAYMKENEPF